MSTSIINGVASGAPPIGLLPNQCEVTINAVNQEGLPIPNAVVTAETTNEATFAASAIVLAVDEEYCTDGDGQVKIRMIRSTEFLGGSESIYEIKIDPPEGIPVRFNYRVPDEDTATATAEIVVVAQPQSVAVSVGETATFSVTTSDVVTYQWQSNAGGVSYRDISGATQASYTTQALGLEDDGTLFRVILESASSTMESSPATLNVT